jgi:hypothetical protein
MSPVRGLTQGDDGYFMVINLGLPRAVNRLEFMETLTG